MLLDTIKTVSFTEHTIQVIADLITRDAFTALTYPNYDYFKLAAKTNLIVFG